MGLSKGFDMDCPKCCGKLKQEFIEGVEIDTCFVCEGIWFDAGELEKIIEKDSKNFNFIDLGKKDFDGKEIANLRKLVDSKEGKCPKCVDGTILLREEYKTNSILRVDICPHGHGIWLDGGEILELRRRFWVDLRDKIIFCVDFIKFYYSKKGIQAARMSREKQENNSKDQFS